MGTFDIKYVKNYLKQARMLDLQVSVKLDELHNLEQLATCVSSPKTGDKVKSSKENNSMSTVDKIVDLQNVINSEIDKLVDLKEEIHNKIETMSNPIEKAVLTERYLNCLNWDEIATVIGYERTRVFDIHSKALEHFKNGLNRTFSE